MAIVRRFDGIATRELVRFSMIADILRLDCDAREGRQQDGENGRGIKMENAWKRKTDGSD